jgi:UDP-glucose 4-epimerase
MTTKTILVTGGAGHVGSHLVELLVTQPGNRVISIDNYFAGQRSNHIPGAEYREGHTKDIARLIPETPDVVYHLGEYARIAPSFDDVAAVYDMNIVGTFAVAEFCRTRSVGKLVYAASSTKFATEGDGRHQNPYSFSKAVNVDLVNDYGRWYDLPYAICYLSNGYGPREQADGRYATLIAKFERLHVTGEPLTVSSPGTQLRAYTFVKDLARGIQLAGEKGKGDGYILCAKKKYSVLDIAKAFGGRVVMTDEYPGRTDAETDVSKARDELGWEPTLDVMDYIREFVRANPPHKTT